ncbi:hypothetical protein HNY73_013676 [Argiope bruennichi]|uniref:Uncharacterized protein n=1 Tax=Argiope bruennichi TaxID=94029 RepID=A0A8T0F0X8_ARGBR|nr:hypothetical protein HNY73_013676 [Argiope bruennichi]
MVKQAVPTLKILVVGDPDSGKNNFIKKMLHYYPSSAEVHRKNDTTHFMFKPDKHLKIHLHDVSNKEIIQHRFCGNMDAVFFCYAANDPESFQSLEKWIHLAEVEKKVMHSFLVAETSNVSSERDVAERLAEQARELKEGFRMKHFIESSFDDEESASSWFHTILNEISLPILNGSSNKLNKESPESLHRVYLSDKFPCTFPTLYLNKISCQSFLDYGEEDIEKIFRYENHPKTHLKFF